MSFLTGKGWPGESRRHSDAAKKGAKGKRSTAANRKEMAKKAAIDAGKETKDELKARDLALSFGGATVETTKADRKPRVRKGEE